MPTLQPTLDFLSGLSQNNNKDWFDANRARYKRARDAFEDLIAEVIVALGPYDDFGILLPKEAMFRINRDVRFTKDKSPYNTQMSAQIAKGGRHGESRGYYFHITPGGSFMAAGLYEPDKTQLDNVRQHLAADDQPLRRIIGDPDFIRYFGTLRGEQLKTAPAGYDRTHPAIDLIRYKQFLVMHTMTDADLLDEELIPRLVGVRHAMQPLLDYLDKASGSPPKKR